jgi:hypothetical protein
MTKKLDYIYRVYDPQYDCWSSSGQGRTFWSMRHFAQHVCDKDNNFREGTRAMRCVVKKYKLTEVPDD